MLQVHTSNQSPLSDQVGTAVVVVGYDSLTHRRRRRLVTSRGTSGSVMRRYRERTFGRIRRMAPAVGRKGAGAAIRVSVTVVPKARA
jgi:hypothetical protein